MARAPVAYKDIAVPGFPNYFFTAGPNDLAINASYFKNMECNVNTIVRLLQSKQSAGMDSIGVRPEISDTYNATLSDRYETYSWGASNSDSYYRTETGHAPFLFRRLQGVSRPARSVLNREFSAALRSQSGVQSHCASDSPTSPISDSSITSFENQVSPVDRAVSVPSTSPRAGRQWVYCYNGWIIETNNSHHRG